ncbi:MAG: two-component regulator propeller domain-containing protein [Verrucomicrobiota bacterium]|jgi:ligand-binding sensor domain-containing protein/signal transduction histidine kinase
MIQGPNVLPGRTRVETSCRRRRRRLAALVLSVVLGWAGASRAVLLWSDLGATQVHETGAGSDILGGVLRRDATAHDALYFKFHVDPLSDATTEEYFAAFQLFEGSQERLAVGNALKAWAYSAFATGETNPSNQVVEYIDLNSSKPERPSLVATSTYELPHWGIERTIVFKVQYMPGGEDLVTVWLEPDLRPGATENSQPEALTTRFKANGSFDQIRLRHAGGGAGWIFSEMAIATSFSDFVNANESETGGEAPFTFRSWQREQGLPENDVRALAQTRDGYLWVASDEGVCRFDGVDFFSLGLPEGFQSGPVRVLFGDSRGALWIGTADGGLNRWQDGRLSKFTVRDGLPSDTITALAEDSAGCLWIGTPAGLAVLHGDQVSAPAGAEQFAGKTVTTLYCDRQGAMWVGAAGVGIFSCAGGKFTPLTNPALDHLLRDPHCVLVDKKGRLWIGAGDAFVLCRDGGQWLRFGMPRHLATHSISALAEGPDETLWAGSAGEGLFEFKDGRLVAINASSGLPDNMVETLLMDREGKLWVGTHGGLDRICPKKVSVLGHNDGLDYGEVKGLTEIRPGLVWAAQPNGVYQWDGRVFRRLIFFGLSPGAFPVSAVLAGRDGGCWVAPDLGLLHFKDAQSAELEPGTPALTNLSISALGQNWARGEVWAGARNGELWHFLDGKWTAEKSFPAGHAITGIVPTANDSLWVGTEGDGLYRLDTGPGARFEKLKGLPSGWIRTLHLDAQGILWIGTGGGLSRLQNGEIFTFTMREGLPDNTISQILEDDDGGLWLGGNRGIVRVRKQDLEDLAARKIPAVYPQIYGRADGMLSEECTSGLFPAGLKTSGGTLWIPTLKGIVVVDPRHIVTAPAPAVALEQTLVDGVPVAPVRSGAGAKPAGRGTTDEESLRLAPGKHTLEFRYTGLSFDAPERVRFRYRLEEADPDWVEAGTRRVASYSSVLPGTYHYRIIACNGDGVWNEQGATLTLIVLAHFWQKWWFLGGAALGTVATGIGGVRLVVRRRLHRRLKRLEQDRMLEHERTRIAQDLHDMMGAKLCRISFMSENVRRNQTIQGELQDQIRSMADDSREVLRSLDEIVWAVNPEKDTLEHLVSYIAQYAQEYFRRTGIELDLEVPPQLPAQPLTSQSRHHLFLAVHEALTNLLKHSGATRANIAMNRRGSEFEIAVSDNGRGFDPADREAGAASSAAGFGNGVGNMRRRLAELGGRCELQSRPGQGTTVRFAFSLDAPDDKVAL